MPLPPRNPYLDYSLRDLATEAMHWARALRGEERVGRQRIAFLLIAVGHRLAPDNVHPNSPHREVRRGQPAAVAFGEKIKGDVASVRWRLLRQAEDALALPPNPCPGWARGKHCSSDEACLAALAMMDEIARSMAGKAGSAGRTD